jgi:uncharacterized protein
VLNGPALKSGSPICDPEKIGQGNPLGSVGRIIEIWRYPVSSVGGERLASINLGPDGVAGDRQYGLIDRATGSPATPEKDIRWRKALYLQAKCVAGQFPTLTFPDGHSYPVDDRDLNAVMSDYFGFAAAIAAYEHSEEKFDFPLTQYRHQHFPVHLVTTASLKQLAKLRQVRSIDSRRFRPTVLIDVSEGHGFLENEWIGQRLRLGAIELKACDKTKRCGVTFVSQPGLEDDPEILRTILRHNKRNFGIYCSVENAGTIQLDDELFI